MKDIEQLTVTQVRLYPVDSLPLDELRQLNNRNIIKNSFQFDKAQVDPLTNQVVFNNGTFEEGKQLVHILNLAVEKRRILLQVRDSSLAGNSVAATLARLLESFQKDPKAKRVEPLLLAEETECVATLDIDFEDLIAAPVLRVVQRDGQSRFATNYLIPKSIAFKKLSFEVRYEADPKLEDHEVTLASKLISIEARAGVPSQERRFYIVSPTDSETHRKILESLEKEVLGLKRNK